MLPTLFAVGKFIMKNKYMKGVSANVFLLGIVSFLNDLSSEMIMPILPMFVTALGGAGLAVGLVGGFRDSISSILKVFCGYWSDRTGKRKIFVSSGYLTSSLFKFLLALSKTCQHVVIFAALERLGKGLRTAARDAIIAESMAKERGKGFGIHRAFDTSGAILGSIVVFLLFWFFGFSFKLIILIAGVVAFASLIPLRFVNEGKTEPRDITLKIGLKNLPTSLKLFILISGIFALGNFSYMFFIIRAQQFFPGKLPIAAVPILLYVLFNIFYAGFAVPLGALSDKLGREKVIILGYLLFSLTSLGFAFLTSLLAFIVLFALYGITYAAVDGNQRAFVSDLSSRQLNATALGTFHTTIGLMALPASLIAGFLWQNIAPEITFIYGSIPGFISVLLFIAFGNYFGVPKELNK
jgi:MFS family permease